MVRYFKDNFSGAKVQPGVFVYKCFLKVKYREIWSGFELQKKRIMKKWTERTKQNLYGFFQTKKLRPVCKCYEYDWNPMTHDMSTHLYYFSPGFIYTNPCLPYILFWWKNIL